MNDPFDPAAMSPEERDLEVAGLLARGFLRLSMACAPGVRPSTGKALDVPGNHAAPCVPGDRR